MEPLCLADFESCARRNLRRYVFEYVAGGSKEETTLKENREAYKRLKVRPRVLRGISQVDMKTTILGEEISMPICIAPTALQKMYHSDGEIATARAADKSKTCMVLSCGANTSLEDVTAAVPASLKWFLLYLLKSREMSRKLVQRAERAGYKAIVVTVDAPVNGRKLCDVRNHSLLSPHFDSDFPNIQSPYEGKDGPPRKPLGYSNIGNCISFEDIDWLRTITKLPIILKGILTADDARRAADHSVAGIVVSNHGGRQLDSVPATIEVLPEIVEAVQGRLEVYIDGGVRLGTDVLKALALGARAVFIGRPVVWGLAYKGEEGVSKVLELLREELKVAMMLSGCASIADIKPSMIMTTSAKM